MKRRTRRRKSNQGMSPTSVGAFLSPRDEDVYYNLDYRASQPAPLRGEDAGFAQSVGEKKFELMSAEAVWEKTSKGRFIVSNYIFSQPPSKLLKNDPREKKKLN